MQLTRKLFQPFLDWVMQYHSQGFAEDLEAVFERYLKWKKSRP